MTLKKPMTIEEIAALFEAANNRKNIITPHRRYCDRPLSRNTSHLIYSYKALPELIKKLKKVERFHLDYEEEYQLERFAVRYVVDETGTIWFAREGATSQTIPDHAQISHFCYSAGNIYFSEDYQSIVKITNKSGHFTPDPDTLVYAIAALSSVGANFAATLSLVMHTKDDSIITELSAEQLLSLLPEAHFPASKNEFTIKISFIDDIITVTDPKDVDSTIAQKLYAPTHSLSYDSDDNSEDHFQFKIPRCNTPQPSFFSTPPTKDNSP